MSTISPAKEPPSRIPVVARSPAVAPIKPPPSRPASKSVTSAPPAPSSRVPTPPTSRPASRSVATRPPTSTSAKSSATSSPAAAATPTRPASRSVSKPVVAATTAAAAAVPATRPVSRSTSKPAASSSSTASSTASASATPRTARAAASPVTRPVSRSVTRPPTAASAASRAEAPSSKASNPPAPRSSSKTATATPSSAAASPLTLPAAANIPAPAPLSLPPQATEPPSSNSTTAVTAAAEPPQSAPTAADKPSDPPPPTDPSVPVYHAPHYRPEVHSVGRKRPSMALRSRSESASTAQELEAKVSEWREEYLAMSVEEVADWLQRVLGNKPLADYIPTTGRRETLDKERAEAAHRTSLSLTHPLLPPPSPLFDALQTGVLLCQLALAIDATLTVRYKAAAAVGSFFARDNINSFLDVCAGWGVLRSQLFEVDDLVMRKSDRGVVNSLLDITRVVYLRFPQVLPPQLVQFELEIAALEAQPPPPPPPPPPAKPVEPPTPPPPPPTAPAEPAKPRGPRYLPYVADESDALDVAVGRIVNGHALDTLVKRVMRGQYWIAEEKVHHLRLVRHLVLVRVGGGWEGMLPMTSRKILEGVGDDGGGAAAGT